MKFLLLVGVLSLGTSAFADVIRCFEGVSSVGEKCSVQTQDFGSSDIIISPRNVACGKESYVDYSVSDSEIVSKFANTISYKSVSGSKDTRTDVELTLDSRTGTPSEVSVKYWPQTFRGITLKSPSQTLECSNLKLKK